MCSYMEYMTFQYHSRRYKLIYLCYRLISFIIVFIYIKETRQRIENLYLILSFYYSENIGYQQEKLEQRHFSYCLSSMPLQNDSNIAIIFEDIDKLDCQENTLLISCELVN